MLLGLVLVCTPLDWDLLLDKVHPYRGCEDPIGEPISDVGPVVWCTSSDIVIHPSARTERAIASPTVMFVPFIRIVWNVNGHFRILDLVRGRGWVCAAEDDCAAVRLCSYNLVQKEVATANMFLSSRLRIEQLGVTTSGI